jgi:hypothetical protein
MKRLIFGAFTLLLAASATGEAAETRMSKTDGAKLLSICTARAENLVQGCEAYLDGVADTVGVYQHEQQATPDKQAPHICMPATVTGVQLRQVAVGYVQAHPADRGRFAALLVTRALGEAYPCR